MYGTSVWLNDTKSPIRFVLLKDLTLNCWKSTLNSARNSPKNGSIDAL